MAQLTFRSPTHVLLTTLLQAKPRTKLKLIDYGCGEGELLEYLDHTRIGQYVGFEVNSMSLTTARKRWKRMKNVHFTQIHRKKLPSFGKKHSVDAIFLVGVVQYLPQKDLDHVLVEARRVLKPNGQLLISSTDEHLLYRFLNIYRFFLPHFCVHRQTLITKIQRAGLQIDKQFERGVFLAPIFSNVIVFFFDALDKILYRTKGNLGPIGRGARQFFSPLIQAEFSIKIDYGYTLFVVASLH